MKLHFHPVSVTSRPVLLFAAESGIELEKNVVDLMTGAHHQEPFTSLNPRRLVPVLEAGDFVLAESSAILKYLADKIDSPAYPKDLKKRARVNERMDYFNTSFYREFGYHVVYPQVFPHHARKDEAATKSTIEWGCEKAAAELAIIDQHLLGKQKFVCGDEISLADYLGGCFVTAGDWIRVDYSKYPNVNRWVQSLRALPSWNAVNEVHSGFAKSLEAKTFAVPA